MQVYLLVGLGLLGVVFVVFKIYTSKLQAENYKLNTKLELLLRECDKLFADNSGLRQQYNEEVEAKFIAQQKEALALQKCEAIQEQMNAWEQHKQQSIENAKAAIFEVGHKLSNQLIEETKRENTAQKEESQKHFKTTTDKLYQDFSKLTEVITTLKDQVNTSQNTTDMVYKALLAPNTVGGLAEITLENILKSSNLIANIDYQMQYSIMDQDNNRLRPDAVIFLPGENILVIDSKASKFFLELGQAKDEKEANEIKQKLKNTMRNHLKSLASKDYRQAIQSHLKNKKINHISTVMFLPTEASLEQLQDIDKQIVTDSWQNNIYPAGPIGLVNILSHAKFQISEERKNENYHIIITEVSGLLYNIANLAGYAKKLGSSIYNSMNYFDKFAASFNANLISKAKKIEQLGVSVKTNKQMPEKLERYQIITGQKLTTIEGETESLVEEEEGDST